MSPCFAPNCNSGYNSKTTHCFRPDGSVAETWVKILTKIRSDVLFDPRNVNHRLCNFHFESNQIISTDDFIINGKKESVPRFRWKLVKGAIPTIFPSLPEYRQLREPRKRKLPARIPVKKNKEPENGKALLNYLRENYSSSQWIANENVDHGNSFIEFYMEENTADQKVLKVHKNFVCEAFYAGKNVTSLMPTIFHTAALEGKQESFSNVITALKNLETLKKCCGIKGFHQVKKFKGGDYNDFTWYSSGCQKFGFFTICTPCKSLLPSLQRTMFRLQDQEAKFKKVQEVKTKKYHYLKSRTNKLQQANTKLKMEVKRMQIKLKHADTIRIEELIMKNDKIPVPFQKAVIQALKIAKLKSSKGMRYDMDWLLECLLLRIKSPKAYVHLRNSKLLPLPHPTTLQKLICSQPCEFGFNTISLSAIQNKLSGKSQQDRQGTLMFDEIQLRQSLDFNKGTLKLDGFINYGDYTEELLTNSEKTQLADHALVLLYRPFKEQWVQPIAAFATKGAAKGNCLQKIVMAAVVKLESIGAEVVSLVADGASTNKSFWNKLGITGELGMVNNKIIHPCNADRFLYFICDVPHLIKCVRNHFRKYRNVKFDGEEICFNFYEELLKEDETRLFGLRKCPKLSNSHIAPNSFEKMNVALATQLFSRSAATGIKFYRKLGIKGFQKSETTENFTQCMNDVFDALNGRFYKDALRTDSVELNILQMFLDTIDQKDETNEKGEIEAKNTFASSQTLAALRVTITSVIEITEYLVNDIKFEYLLPNRLNQDPLEGFFGLARAAGGQEDHPTVCNFIHIFRLLSLYTPVKQVIRGNVANYENPSVLASFGSSLRSNSKKTKAARKEKVTEIEQLIMKKISEAGNTSSTSKGTLADASIVYYLCGYVIRKAHKFVACKECLNAIQNLNPQQGNLPNYSSLCCIMDYGNYLKHPSTRFFNFMHKNIETSLVDVLSKNLLYGDIMFRIIENVGKINVNGIGCGVENHDFQLLVKIIPFYVTTRLYFYSNSVRNKLGHGKATRQKRKQSKLENK